MCDLKTGTAKSTQDKPTKSNLTGVIDYVYEYYLAMYWEDDPKAIAFQHQRKSTECKDSRLGCNYL